MDQNPMINQAHMISMSHPQMGNQSHVINQSQSQVMNQPQVINQPQFLNQSQLMNHSQIMSQSQPQAMQQSQMMMSQSQPPMMSGNYKVWARPQPPLDPNLKYRNFSKPNYGNMKQSRSGRGNWKGKGVGDKRINNRRMDKSLPGSITGPNNAGGYQPPSLHQLQSQNRMKARKFYSKKKFNNRFAPYAPRNTTSFIIRAKKSGGIASLVSPCPVTPAVLPTPMFSPSREALGDMAKEEWGVDGYGSMKGLIRLRGSENRAEMHEGEDEECGGGSSDSEVEEHLEVERKLDHDLSRFEMIYQNYGVEYNNCLENRVDDQDSHIAQLEEENLTLKERLFLMERELVDLRRKLQLLEGQNPIIDDLNEEVVENMSENESDGGLEMEYVSEIRPNQDADVDSKEDDEEVLEIEGEEKCVGEDLTRGAKAEEKYVVKDEILKESDEQLPEDNVAKDEESKGELVSGKVNECENMEEKYVVKDEILKESDECLPVDDVAKDEELKGELESGKVNECEDMEEKYVVKDEILKESDEQLPEDNVAKDEESKGELVSGKVNECEDMEEKYVVKDEILKKSDECHPEDDLAKDEELKGEIESGKVNECEDMEEKYVVKDEILKESDEQLPEDNVAKDEESKDELVSGKVNECEDMDANFGNTLHSGFRD